jgi:Ca-activated chloride channel family protein
LEEANLAMDKAQRGKVIVLVTDGEDLEKGGLRVAEKLGKRGVVVFSVGVGTAAGSEIQFLNEQGKLENLEDSKGQVVRSRLDEPTLRGIAQVTHGAYYPLGPVGEGLAKIRFDLENLSTSSGSAPERKLGVDRFHLPLAAGLLLLTIEPLIGTRRRLRHSSAVKLQELSP